MVLNEGVARITVSSVESWQPIARIYVETHELQESDQFAVWHLLTWSQSIADKYEKAFGRDAMKIYGKAHYIDFVSANAEKDTRYPSAFALKLR